MTRTVLVCLHSHLGFSPNKSSVHRVTWTYSSSTCCWCQTLSETVFTGTILLSRAVHWVTADPCWPWWLLPPFWGHGPCRLHQLEPLRLLVLVLILNIHVNLFITSLFISHVWMSCVVTTLTRTATNTAAIVLWVYSDTYNLFGLSRHESILVYCTVSYSISVSLILEHLLWKNKAAVSFLWSFLEQGEIKVSFDTMTVVTLWLQRCFGSCICWEKLWLLFNIISKEITLGSRRLRIFWALRAQSTRG